MLIDTGATADPGFPKHFDGKRFYNPDAPQAPGFLAALRWKLTSRPEPSPTFISDVEQSIPPRRVEGSELRTTLVNHSTVLLQQRGCNILTDPIWSERASPLSWAGPHRRRKPGVSSENLPPIDAVLISHNHYDHLAGGSWRFYIHRSGSRGSAASLPEHSARSRVGLGRIIVTPRLHRPLRPRSAFLKPGNLRSQPDPMVRVHDRVPVAADIFRGRHRVRASLRPDSRKVRTAAPGAIADRSL